MAGNLPVSKESFGEPVKSPGLKKGSIKLFGHLANDAVVPDRGLSVNQKTGYPSSNKG